MADFELRDLVATIASRADALPETSYTASLLKMGPAYCARKFGEESVETIVAAVEGDKQALTGEAADVLFHFLVLLQVAGVPYQDVLDELERRRSRTGHEEKAARDPD